MEIEKYTEKRPWGNFVQFVKNEKATVKIISVNPLETLSLQYHERRSEFWRVIGGEGFVTIGDKEIPAGEGDEFTVPVKEKHRMRAGAPGLKVLEISLGEFDENDIVRLEDKYGRAG